VENENPFFTALFHAFRRPQPAFRLWTKNDKAFFFELIKNKT
jgi:hypothetical protein